MSVTHFDVRPSPLHAVVHSVACGPTVYAARASTDPHDVTCRRCKNTIAYKASVNGAAFGSNPPSDTTEGQDDG